VFRASGVTAHLPFLPGHKATPSPACRARLRKIVATFPDPNFTPSAKSVERPAVQRRARRRAGPLMLHQCPGGGSSAATAGSTVRGQMPLCLRRSQWYSTSCWRSWLEFRLVNHPRLTRPSNSKPARGHLSPPRPLTWPRLLFRKSTHVRLGVARLAALTLQGAACPSPVLRGLTLPGVIGDPSNYLLACEG
jgi:hypothetical protein